MNAIEQTNLGKVHGSVAFAAGMPCAPAMDKNARDVASGKPVGSCAAYFKAWQRGWIEASLAA